MTCRRSNVEGRRQRRGSGLGVAHSPVGVRRSKFVNAFTLLEVMVAVGIFFLATFTILELVTRSLRAARSLQHPGPTPGMVAAELTVATNRLEEGVRSGDFGNLYPDYRWETDTYLDTDSTNGLYQVDISVFHTAPGQVGESRLSILLWDRNWNAGGPGGRRR